MSKGINKPLSRRFIMLRRKILSLLGVLFLGMGVSSISHARNKEPKPVSAASTIDDQTGMALMIYNSNLGLVRDQRLIKLLKGIGDLRFMDVASQLIATKKVKLTYRVRMRY
jgi:hypothetical protein